MYLELFISLPAYYCLNQIKHFFDLKYIFIFLSVKAQVFLEKVYVLIVGAKDQDPSPIWHSSPKPKDRIEDYK